MFAYPSSLITCRLIGSVEPKGNLLVVFRNTIGIWPVIIGFKLIMIGSSQIIETAYCRVKEEDAGARKVSQTAENLGGVNWNGVHVGLVKNSKPILPSVDCYQRMVDVTCRVIE